MVTVETSIDEREGRKKFSFASFTRLFRCTRKEKVDKDPKVKKKSKFLKFFRCRKKPQQEPEPIEFESGYGEFVP